MKKIILLFLLTGTFPAFCQNYLYHVAPASVTVAGEHGEDIYASAIIYRDLTNPYTWTFTATQCSGPTNSVKGIYYENSGMIGGGGGTCKVDFRFRKPAAQGYTTENYSFVLHFSDQSGDCETTMSSVVNITINYTPATCDIALSGLSATTSPTSLILNWNNNPDAASYLLEYKVNGTSSWTSLTKGFDCYGNACSRMITGLTPSTTYNWRVRAKCSNGVFGSYTSSSATTSSCPLTAPTNLNATAWNNGYTISFTPITGISGYYMDWEDLVTGEHGTTNLIYSSVPTYDNYFYYIPQDHSFKFRIYPYSGCSASYSAWETIIPPTCLPSSYPANLALANPCGTYVPGSSCGSGVFSWTAVTGATQYKVEYTIFNLSGVTINGNFTCVSNSNSVSNLYAPSSGAQWFLKYKVKAKCQDGSWSDFSSETTFPW